MARRSQPGGVCEAENGHSGGEGIGGLMRGRWLGSRRFEKRRVLDMDHFGGDNRMCNAAVEWDLERE